MKHAPLIFSSFSISDDKVNRLGNKKHIFILNQGKGKNTWFIFSGNCEQLPWRHKKTYIFLFELLFL